MLSELLERRLINDAKEWAVECGLKPPFVFGVNCNDSVIQVLVTETTGKNRAGTCTYTRGGQRNMYELERGK